MSRAKMILGLADDEAAALWADLEVRPEFSAADRRELAAWLSVDARRAELLASHRQLVDEPALGTALRGAARPRAPRRWWTAGATAIAASAVLTVALGGPQLTGLLAGQALSTDRGEARREVLADGSQVHLNGATRARVRLGPAARKVRLDEGEAYFAVAHDPARPFSVTSPHGVVTAVGTQFDVDRLDDATEVSVYEGRVRVEPAGGGAPVYLSAGERARIAGGAVTRLAGFEPAQARDWRSGWLEVENAPLADLLTELNRASAQPIVAEGAATAGLSVSGRFRLSDPAGAAAMVAALHGLEVRREGERIVLAGG